MLFVTPRQKFQEPCTVAEVLWKHLGKVHKKTGVEFKKLP